MSDAEKAMISADLESGSYYSDSRKWYSEIFHTPIAQRSYYIIVILLALINSYFGVQSFLGVFPLSHIVPFAIYSNNVWEDIPRIRRISTKSSENKGVAVMKFLLASYVENRESYDLPQFELRYRNIWSQSTKEVFEEFKKQIDASNPYSFYQLYTNRSRRAIYVESMDFESGKNEYVAHVVYTASVLSLSNNDEIGHSKWRADLTYKYTNFWVDQSLDTNNKMAKLFGLTGDSVRTSGEKRKVIPMTFIVSDYKVKELLE